MTNDMNNDNLNQEFDDTQVPNILTLSDEDGQEHQFELIDSLELEGQMYTALIPYYETEEDMLMSDGQLLILKVMPEEENPEEEYLSIIEDEEEFNKISDIFVERLSDLYEIEE